VPPDKRNDERIYSVDRREEISRADPGALPRKNRRRETARGPKDRGAKLKFCNLDPEVRIGADIIGLDKVASIYGTEHEAIKAFAEE
jgi:hypothetical protein